MDQIKFNNFVKQKENFKLFLSLMNHYEEAILTNNEEKIEHLKEMLKSQHNANKYNLENLDITFDDTGKIRSLNDKIRELEKKSAENSTMDSTEIASFINLVSDNISKILKNKYGLNLHLNISIGTSMNVKISYIKVVKQLSKSDANYYRSESNFNEEYQKRVKQLEILKTSDLDYSEDGDIYYTDRNKEILENALKDAFSEQGHIIEFKHELTFFNSKAKKGAKEMYMFYDSEFNLNLLASHRAFAETFKS
jgi:hypothetical protein